MLLHIAITIDSTQEIENFYEKVLLFTVQRKFSINEEISHKIFKTEEAADVYMMEHNSVQFEIFVSCKKEKKVFSHVCLAYRNANIIYKKAVELGYRALIKRNQGNDTYFIWDKNANMFEIKEIQNIII